MQIIITNMNVIVEVEESKQEKYLVLSPNTEPNRDAMSMDRILVKKKPT